jgi:hypothetical protein
MRYVTLFLGGLLVALGILLVSGYYTAVVRLLG